jgi:hypothetical protein
LKYQKKGTCKKTVAGAKEITRTAPSPSSPAHKKPTALSHHLQLLLLVYVHIHYQLFIAKLPTPPSPPPPPLAFPQK